MALTEGGDPEAECGLDSSATIQIKKMPKTPIVKAPRLRARERLDLRLKLALLFT